MSAGRYNIKIEQGATFRFDITYRDSLSQPVNLTGMTARMQIRPIPSSSTILVNATVANGRIALTPLTGRIVVTLSATETAALDFTTARYDLELEALDGTVTRLIEGTVTLSPEVTR